MARLFPSHFLFVLNRVLFFACAYSPEERVLHVCVCVSCVGIGRLVGWLGERNLVLRGIVHFPSANDYLNISNKLYHLMSANPFPILALSLSFFCVVSRHI